MTNEEINQIWQNIVEYAKEGLEYEENSDPLFLFSALKIKKELLQLRTTWDKLTHQALLDAQKGE